MNDELLAELAGQFRASLRDRLETMRTLVARLDGDRADRETLVLVHRHFHGLAGLGGTYGFPRVSEIAAAAEAACDAVLEAAPPDDAFIALLRNAIDSIGREAGGG
jgi:chemotaxis protein histidine kinase CheA